MRELLRRLRGLFTNRMVILAMVFAVILFFLWQNLFKLQVLNSRTYDELDPGTYVSTAVTDGTRGEIYDRYGRALAYNEYTWSLYYDSSTQTEDLNALCHKIAKVLEDNDVKTVLDFAIGYSESRGFYYYSEYQDSAVLRQLFLADMYSKSSTQLTAEEKRTTAEEAYLFMRDELFEISQSIYSIQDILEIMRLRYAIYNQRFKTDEPILIASNLPEALRVTLSERSQEYPGLEFLMRENRVYPGGEAFAHIIGYMSSIPDSRLEEYQDRGYDPDDSIGIEGLEAVYESSLRGTQGMVKVTYNSLTNAEVSRETVQEATKGNDIYLTIDQDLQQQAYTILVEKIKSLLIEKITGVSTINGSEYSASDVLIALLENGFLQPEALMSATGTYGSSFQKIYLQYANTQINTLMDAVLNPSLQIQQYDSDLMQLYNSWIEIMRDAEGVLSSDYQKAGAFYDQYAVGEKTAYEFLEYCIYNNMLDLEQYGLEHEMDVDVIIDTVVRQEMEKLKENTSFQEILYGRLLKSGVYSEEEFLLLLYDAGVLDASDGTRDSLRSGYVTAETVLIQKIRQNEITPSDINLDPCSGSAVITDSDSGEVLAMVSYPSYDNNRITSDAAYYSQIINNASSPLLFRALLETRAPGSTYKMCTAVTALEYGVTDAQETIYDAYRFMLANSDDKPVCHSTTSHGSINVVDALRVSCNYYFYTMGYRLSDPVDEEFNDAVGLAKLTRYAKELGLCELTGIELAEAMPVSSTQDAVRSAIGQGTNAYTPANINRYTSTLAENGAVYDLYLVDRIVDYSGTVLYQSEPVVRQADVSQSTFDTVRQGMVSMAASTSVLSDFMERSGITLAGKTGTAQELNDRPDHALFTGYTNVDDPDITVTIVIPFGGGSSRAIDTFVRLAEAYYAIVS